MTRTIRLSVWAFTVAITAATVCSAPVAGHFPVIVTGSARWPGNTALDAAHTDNVFELHGTVSNTAIGPVFIRNAFRAIDTSSDADVNQFTVEGLTAEVTGGCIRTHGRNIVIRNTRCTMVGGPQHGDVNIPFGLQVTSGNRIVVENSHFDGFTWEAPPWRYWIGEGISIERGVEGVTLRNVAADGNTDAGFDIKPFARLDQVSASGNCRNFRFWSGADAVRLTAGETVKRGGNTSCSAIWLNGSAIGVRPRLHIHEFSVRMTRGDAIIIVENGPADIILDTCDIQAPSNIPLVRFNDGQGRLTLGRGCRRGPSG